MVTDAADKERFEARDADGGLAGVLTYQATGPIVVYTHTRAEEGHPGVEDALAKAAMEDAKAKGRTVVPMCPTLSAWLDKHHEYDNLVARSTKRVK